MWNSLLETWILSLTPKNPQALYQGCVVVTWSYDNIGWERAIFHWRKCTFSLYILHFLHFGPYILFLLLLVPKPINAWHLGPFRHLTHGKNWRDWREHVHILCVLPIINLQQKYKPSSQILTKPQTHIPIKQTLASKHQKNPKSPLPNQRT